MTASIDHIFTYLEHHQDEALEQLQELLRFPSVSTQSEHNGDVQACAGWLHDHFTELGLSSEIIPTAKHPVVLAETAKRDDRPTVVVYGHYDVQPAEPLELWKTPAFQPDIRDGRIYARGATDDKGQMFTHLKAAEAWLKTSGETPVNLIFLIEGEEEIGSPNLGTFLDDYKDRLQCDYIAISDTAQFAPGVPAITYSLRGIVCYELVVKSASEDLHSGVFGGAVPNPLHVLTELLASMRDENGRITVPGFYDDVLEIEDWEREQWKGLPFDEEAFKANLGVAGLAGEAGYSSIERRWARPTLEINGISGGYAGEGFKTVLPAKAVAKISMRLVPKQNPDDIAQKFVSYISENMPDYVTFELSPEHFGAPALVATDSLGMEAAKRAIAKGFGAEPVLMREGGSIPIVNLFAEKLGVDSLLLGWGQNDDGAHAPNERLALSDFFGGIRSAAALYGELAALAEKK